MIHPSPQNSAFERPPLKRTECKPFRFQNKQSRSEKGHDLWLLTLSDLLLLLMIFFVILFAMTFQEQRQVFHPPSSQAATPMKAEETPAGMPPVHVQDSVSKEKLASLEAELRQILGDEGDKDGVSVIRHADHLVLTFPERIIFDPARVQLKPSVQPILDKVASLACAHPYLLVEVQGHTDDRPINTKRYPSNWELSVDRAIQVAQALIRLGLDPGRLTVKGFGEYRALFPNDSDSNRHKNRRVEVQFFLNPQS
jgi:chemotaxis protein MotB